jgi:four helix bundle protein
VKENNIIAELTFDFALEIFPLYRFLVNQKDFILSHQLLKSATSIGANVEEALAGKTFKDFITKMSIASKEARETRYWLKLLAKSQFYPYNYTSYLEKIESIIRILTKIVKTSQSKI